MVTLLDLLPSADGSDAIRRCWGDVPQFRYCEILHLKQTETNDGTQGALLTALFITYGPEEVNECKPSRIIIEFSRLSHWEYAFCPEANGTRLAIALSSPLPGTIAINVDHSFYVICRGIRVVRCDREHFTDDGDR
jgi:hypothetical protein